MLIGVAIVIVSTAKTITPPGAQEVLDYKGEISSLRRPSLAAVETARTIA
jgi:hypothetical protein